MLITTRLTGFLVFLTAHSIGCSSMYYYYIKYLSWLEHDFITLQYAIDLVQHRFLISYT